MLTSALRVIVNNLFWESFDTIFIGNENKFTGVERDSIL